MKKSLFLQCALSALLLFSATSCSDDEPNNGGNGDNNDKETPTATAGVYVLNQGQYYMSIEGSLNYFDYSSKTVSTDLFQKANKRFLGDTPQCGVKYGSKIYIGVYGSNTVEILDAKTNVSLKQIKLNAETTGTEPRFMLSDKGKVYITMFDGYVVRLDTLSMEIDARVKVGPNPEKTAIVGRRLFVPNSDGMNWEIGYGTTASIIDLDSFTVTDTVEVPLNPETFLSVGNKLFLLAKGNYSSDPATLIEGAIYEVDPEIAKLQKEGEKGYKFIAKATIVAAGPTDVFYINCPFTSNEKTYGRFDAQTLTKTEWTPKEIEYPNAIAVDPYYGYILIASYIMDGPYPSYIAPGYVARYDSSFNFMDKASVGAGPVCFFFN